jgi:hypothetical protein
MGEEDRSGGEGPAAARRHQAAGRLRLSGGPAGRLSEFCLQPAGSSSRQRWMSHMTCLPAAPPRRLHNPHRDAPPPRPVPQQPGPRAAAASTCCSHAREKGQTSRWLGEEAESGASEGTEGGQGGGPWFSSRLPEWWAPERCGGAATRRRRERSARGEDGVAAEVVHPAARILRSAVVAAAAHPPTTRTCREGGSAPPLTIVDLGGVRTTSS